jgi:hypothetical protein
MATVVGQINKETNQAVSICSIERDGLKYSFNALWDTGANQTNIGKHIIKQLLIPQKGVKPLADINAVQDTSTHMVTLILPEDIIFKEIEVISTNLSGSVDIDALIGMDIIMQGDFSVYHQTDGNVYFCFEYPS